MLSVAPVTLQYQLSVRAGHHSHDHRAGGGGDGNHWSAQTAGEGCRAFELHVMSAALLGEARIADNLVTSSALELALFYNKSSWRGRGSDNPHRWW